MARIGINTGSAANDNTGSTLRAAGGIINDNFLEIYTYLGAGSTTTLSAPVWSTTNAGINTLRNVGLGTTNPRFALEVGAIGSSGTSLYVNGDARITGIVTIGTSSITLNGSSNTINVGTGITINGSTGIISATSIVLGGSTLTGAGVTSITAGSGISVNQSTGNVTITATGGGGSSQWVTSGVGIHTLSNVGIGTTNPTSALTVKGNTSLETLSVSGVSTFNGNIRTNGSNIKLGDGNEAVGNQIKLGNGSGSPDAFGDSADLWIYHNSTYGNLLQDITGTGVEVWTGEFKIANPSNPSENVFYANVSAGTELYYDRNKKFETIGAGVTITGTTFTNQLSVSGVSTFSGQSTFDSGIILSGESSNLSGSQRILLSGGEGGDTQLYNGGTAFSSFIFNSMQGGTTLEVGRLNGSGTLNLPLSQGGINISGVSTLGTVQISSGIVTATSGIVTYYGDTSNATDGRWTLGASGTSDYTFIGIGFTQTTNDPVLYLARGRVYEFVNNSGGSHPFEIRVSNGGAAYSDGVTNNAAATGVIRFEIPFNAPNTLYYQCTVHSGMGNTISVYPSTI
jgi:hypothetical protein